MSTEETARDLGLRPETVKTDSTERRGFSASKKLASALTDAFFDRGKVRVDGRTRS